MTRELRVKTASSKSPVGVPGISAICAIPPNVQEMRFDGVGLKYVRLHARNQFRNFPFTLKSPLPPSSIEFPPRARFR
jgi:hypothetical protein